MSAVREKHVAVIGLGETAETYLAVLPHFPELCLSAVVEPRPERLRHLGDCDLQVYKSTDAMLDSCHVPDLAIVASPTGSHFEIAIPLLLAGCDLLLERPMASTPNDAMRLSDCAERLGRVLITASQFRGCPALATARAAIATDLIGPLQSVECTLSGKRSSQTGWRSEPALSGGGVWMDLGVDALDLVTHLLGEPERIRMVSFRQDGPVEEEACVETEHAGGTRSQIQLSWNQQIAAPIARCIGERGEIWVTHTRTFARTAEGERTLCEGTDPSQGPGRDIAALLRRTRRSGPARRPRRLLRRLATARLSVRA